MDQFVCVRMPQINKLDLTKIQFDYDLTLVIFFMNADGTIYGRYGTRTSVEDTADDMTLDGLAASLTAALKLHEGYPDNTKFLSGKQVAASEYKSPNDLPDLRGKYKDNIDYNGANVMQSCLHCHQVLDAQRRVYRGAGQPIPDKLLYPHPMPDVLGFQLDAKSRATVSDVATGSAAGEAGLKPGDEILTLDGQAVVSTADVQWVLHNSENKKQLDALVLRDGKTGDLTIPLAEGWRRQSNIGWRVTSWDLRRTGTGGMKVDAAPDEVRRQAKVPDGQMALLVKHTGKYGAHAVAHNAGVKVNDVIVSFDGRTDLMNDSQLLAYAAQHTKPNDQVTVVMMRGGQRMEFKIKMQ